MGITPATAKKKENETPNRGFDTKEKATKGVCLRVRIPVEAKPWNKECRKTKSIY